MTDKLDEVTGEESGALAWDQVRAHLHAAVLYQLPRFAGHDRGGAVGDREAWRRASPQELADSIVTYAMAGIGPVLTNEQVSNGVSLMRAVLARAGIDPAGLPWHEAVQDVPS